MFHSAPSHVAPSRAPTTIFDWPLRTLLAIFALAIVCPLLALSGSALYRLQESERQRYHDFTVTTANEAASAVERELRGMFGSLETLATSDLIGEPSPESFYQQASKVAGLLGSSIILFEPVSGRQLLNTRVPFGTPLPQRSDATAQLTATSRAAQVSGVIVGQIAKRPLFGLYVPVVRDDSVIGVLASAYEPSRLSHVLEQSVRTPNWIATAIDQEGKVIARSAQHEEFVGKDVPTWVLRAPVAPQSVTTQATNLQGETSLVATTRVSLSGWIIAVLVPSEVIEEPLRRMWLYFMALSGFAVLSSVVLATMVGRHISLPIAAIASDAVKLGKGEIPPIVTSRLREANAVSAALHESALSRARREQHIELLLREVNHRSKNMLAVVQAIASSTYRGDPHEFLPSFLDRIGSLAASQDLLVASEWHGADLETLVRAELKSFEGIGGSRLSSRGPTVRLSAVAAQNLGMALHELATNSSKYGAFSKPSGQVAIAWEVSGDGPQQRLKLTWIECGGPPVEPPTRRGFGTAVLVDMPRVALKGTVDLEYRREGMRWSLEVPASRVFETGNEDPPLN